MSELTVELEGLHCAACVGRAERVLARVPGVTAAQVNLAGHTATLAFDGAADLGPVSKALGRAGYGLREIETVLALDGMTCASCVARVEGALTALPGVVAARVNLAEGTVRVRHVAGPGMTQMLTARLADAGYPAQIADPGEDRAAAETETARRRFVLSLLLTLPVFVLEMGGHMLPAFHHWAMDRFGMQTLWIAQFVLVSAVMVGPGWPFLRRGFPSLVRGAPDMNSLVALGTSAAWAYSTVATFAPRLLPSHALAVYFEAAAVIVTLILLGRWLEARARGRTGAAIRALMNLTPDTALVETASGTEERPVAALRPGDVIRLRPGEQIAADGTVIDGTSHVDESMMSGEPVPVAKAPGDPVIGGTINTSGALRVRLDRTGADTTLSKIVQMVARAQGARLPVQAVVDRVTLRFVPAVIAVAVVSVAAWLVLGPEPALPHALVAGVSVLIIACPCAMGLATPTSIMVGTGRAASLGVLFRRGEALQQLSEIRGVAFDKTGTLTLGRPELLDLIPGPGFERDAALRKVAAVENLSEHPLARAICRAASVDLPPATGFVAEPGWGASAQVEATTVLVGSARLMTREGVDLSPLSRFADDHAGQGRIVLFAALDGRLAGLFVLADPVKPGARAAIAELRAAGIDVALISGDSRATATAVARELGIDTVRAEVLPEGKVEALEALGPGWAFVGDGINDAPVLAAADVGVAMGQGTDVAIEAADVVLTSDDPRAMVDALRLSRAVMRNIRQNLFWAFAYNTALIPVAAGVLWPVFGIQLSPILAAAAMAASSVFVLSNALRLRGFASRRRDAT
ncbi:MAG: heavy metal translocating P-type ATPase [Gemmobacter sp.]